MAGEAAASLAPLRAEIDAVDAEIVRLLARRMEIVERVVAIKRRDGIAAALPDRVEDVLRRVRGEAAERGLPPELAETVWRALVDWIIAYEEAKLVGRAP